MDKFKDLKLAYRIEALKDSYKKSGIYDTVMRSRSSSQLMLDEVIVVWNYDLVKLVFGANNTDRLDRCLLIVFGLQRNYNLYDMGSKQLIRGYVFDEGKKLHIFDFGYDFDRYNLLKQTALKIIDMNNG